MRRAEQQPAGVLSSSPQVCRIKEQGSHGADCEEEGKRQREKEKEKGKGKRKREQGKIKGGKHKEKEKEKLGKFWETI
jgi:hypothetical protein